MQIWDSLYLFLRTIRIQLSYKFLITRYDSCTKLRVRWWVAYLRLENNGLDTIQYNLHSCYVEWVGWPKRFSPHLVLELRFQPDPAAFLTRFKSKFISQISCHQFSSTSFHAKSLTKSLNKTLTFSKVSFCFLPKPIKWSSKFFNSLGLRL